MKKFCIILLLFFPFFLFGQGELNTEIKVFKRNESSLHIGLTTKGWGFGYRYGKRKDGFRKFLWDFDFTEVKHPREIKLNYGLFRSIYGKKNSFFTINASVGQQKEYFSKLDKSSVAIRAFYTFGFSIGLKKPVYYYVIITDPTTGEESTYLELFDTDNTHGVYYSDAPFFYGLSEIRIVPGLNFKSGVSFEFGNTDRKIRAIELGVFAQAYIKQIEIMASDDNTRYFAGLFLQYRFGKIVNKRLRNTTKEE